MPPKRKTTEVGTAEPPTKRKKPDSSDCGDSQSDQKSMSASRQIEKPVCEEFDLPDATSDENTQLALVKSIIDKCDSDPDIKLDVIETILLYWFQPGGLNDQAVESIEESESFSSRSESFDATKCRRLMDSAMLTLVKRLASDVKH